MDIDLTAFNRGPRLPEMEPARRFAILVLWHVQEDEATELVIEQPDGGGQVPIRYLVDGTWYDLSPFPERVRGDIAQAFLRLAGLSGSVVFPVDADMDARVTDEVHLRWHITVPAADERVHLRRLP